MGNGAGAGRTKGRLIGCILPEWAALSMHLKNREKGEEGPDLTHCRKAAPGDLGVEKAKRLARALRNTVLRHLALNFLQGSATFILCRPFLRLSPSWACSSPCPWGPVRLLR